MRRGELIGRGRKLVKVEDLLLGSNFKGSAAGFQLLRKGIGEAALAHFDPIISVVIMMSFTLMERHCSDEASLLP